MGLKGHLTCGEIIEQLVHASRVTPIRNIVFMVSGRGAGEVRVLLAAAVVVVLLTTV
jgi:hypothetical protein